MRQFALAVVVASFAALAPAAPVPRAVTEKELRDAMWGTERQGECAFRGKELTLRSAPIGKPSWNKSSSPGTAFAKRRVSGDFVATVKLLDASGPNTGNKLANEEAGTSAGLFLGAPGYRFETFLMQQYREQADGKLADPRSWLYTFETSPTEGGGGGGTIERDGKALEFELTRRGNDITSRFRLEGGKWSPPRSARITYQFPPEVEVGVFVNTGVQRTVTATFADLTIDALKLEPKK